jgi:hypothetical protein
MDAQCPGSQRSTINEAPNRRALGCPTRSNYDYRRLSVALGSNFAPERLAAKEKWPNGITRQSTLLLSGHTELLVYYFTRLDCRSVTILATIMLVLSRSQSPFPPRSPTEIVLALCRRVFAERYRKRASANQALMELKSKAVLLNV